ncbi:hypothetical protein EGW08_009960, partial [Elysia chlorotica]
NVSSPSPSSLSSSSSSTLSPSASTLYAQTVGTGMGQPKSRNANLDSVRETNDHVEQTSSYRVQFHAAEKQPCSPTLPTQCVTSPSTLTHPIDTNLSIRSCISRNSGNNNNCSTREHALRERCHQPEVNNSSTMRMAGSHWSRLVVVALLAITCSAVQGSPLPQQSETEQAYRKLKLDTVKYLAQFGYLNGPDRETQNLRSHEDLTRAIKALQKAGNIPQTGVPDRRTEELMARPRCGNTDEAVQRGATYRDPSSQGSELRIRRKRYTVASSKWHRTNLTFRFETYTQRMPREQTRRLISEALSVWSDHTPLSFTEVRHSNPDINILFASRYHSDGYPFDGPGMVLGHAFFPGRGKGGDTHFDDDESWTSNSSSGGVNLFMVAAHEFGHSLGLAHSGDPSALMYPWYMGFEGKFRLPDDDYRGITSLYGAGDTSLPDHRRENEKKKVILIDNANDPTKIDPRYDIEPEEPKVKDTDETPPDYCSSPIDAISFIRQEMFMFIGKWSYRFKKNGQKDIVEIHQFWQGFPKELDHIDAVVELPKPDRRILFFSGNRYWIFNSNHIDKGMTPEGRPITDFNIPEDVKKIDAAFVWGYNNRTYLVSGDMYWKMDINNRFVQYDYPRDMGTWRGVPVPLDAAFLDEDRKTLFFQGLRYWEFYDIRMRVVDGAKHIPRWLNCPKQDTEELKIDSQPSNMDSAVNTQTGDAAERKLEQDKSVKGAASLLQSITPLVLLCFISLLHYCRFT